MGSYWYIHFTIFHGFNFIAVLEKETYSIHSTVGVSIFPFLNNILNKVALHWVILKTFYLLTFVF